MLASEAPVRIGLIHSLNGTMAVSERPLLDVERLAVEEINGAGGVLGRPLEPLVADGASDPSVFAQEAGRLLEQGAAALFGCWTSSSRKAVKAVVEAADSLLFYPVQYEGLEQSSHIVYTGCCLNQQLAPAVKWARGQFGPRAFLLGSDYVYPRVANRMAHALLSGGGGHVVGERYLPLGEMECAAAVAEIRQARPDFVLNTLNGESNLALFRNLQAAGVSAAQLPVISTSAAETEIQPVIDAACGHFACWNYFQSLDTPENRRFVRTFLERHGPTRVCSAAMVSAYAQLFLWKQAVEAAGSPACAEVRRSLPSCRFLSPAGPLVILENRHTPVRAYIGQAQPDGQFAVVWQSEELIAPLPWLGLESSGLPYRALIQEAMASYPETLHAEALVQRVLEERIRERTAQLEATNRLLQTKAEEMVRLDRRKDEFLAMLSHELRNPLAPIGGAASLLRLQLPREPRVQRAEEIIQRQLRHLARLLDDLLDASRITQGKLRLCREQLDLREVADFALENMQTHLQGREEDVVWRRPADPVWVDGDRARLGQLIANLLDNAAKYSTRGQRIELSLEAQPDLPAPQARVRVRDEGQGIARELLPHLFEMFVQGDLSLARARGGLGIGLALVQRIAQMHGGQAEVHSAGPGQGSEFTVTLPLATRPVVSVARPASTHEKPAVPQRVLIVEDNADTAEALTEMVRLWGHEAQSVSDGPAALAAADSFRPDVVLLDIGLPQMDGYEVARRLYERAGKHPRLFAVTGYGREEDRRQAREAHFERHLTKPVDPLTLERLLQADPASQR